MKKSEEENMKHRIDRDTKSYIKSVKEFLKKVNNGNIPEEYSCSLLMLEEYYKQLLILNYEISKLDSYLVMSRYGAVPNPILKARDNTVQKLDLILKSLGCTFKGQVTMKIMDIDKGAEELSPLETIMGGNIEVR